MRVSCFGFLDVKVGDKQPEAVTPAAMTPTDKATDEGKVMGDSQQHTIADFIIHPLIALKPRMPQAEGKQADTSSTTTPSPWQLFGFNAGQGLGSQVSSLAGSVTGWLGNRIQMTGLVDTPVRESTTTTTTTTPKPDVVVRVKQRPSTKKPLISIRGDNERPYRRNKNRNQFNGNRVDDWEDDDDEDFDDEEEEEEEQVVNNKRRRYQANNHADDEEDYDNDEDEDEGEVSSYEHDDEYEDNNDDEVGQDDEAEEEDEEEPVKPMRQNNQRRRNPRPLNNRRRINQNHSNNQRKRFNNNNNNNHSRRQQQRPQPYEESEEFEQYDDDDDDNEAEQEQDFYYNKNQASKRSQTEQSFIQRGQETLRKQIQQFTGGQTPAEISQTMQKDRKSGNKKRRNQATLIIKRNGQTVYVAPELLQVSDAFNGNMKPVASQQFTVTSNQVKKPSSHYPQPPLTVPYKRKGKPTQYITIPWSQLGISPSADINALTNGVQSQPLILNIPQSAIDSMQNPKGGKRKPIITPEAVPLLADASIMDIFKPPRIPPARTPPTTKPTKKHSTQSHSPVLIATKTKTGPTRIRPATVVEKAPAVAETEEKITSEEASDDDASPQLIVIGDESSESQLTRNEYRQILEYFNSRAGRQLNDMQEQQIPVKVISAEEDTTPAPVVPKVDDKMEVENVTDMPVADNAVHESSRADAKESVVETDEQSVVENATESPVHV